MGHLPAEVEGDAAEAAGVCAIGHCPADALLVIDAEGVGVDAVWPIVLVVRECGRKQNVSFTKEEHGLCESRGACNPSAEVRRL